MKENLTEKEKKNDSFKEIVANKELYIVEIEKDKREIETKYSKTRRKSIVRAPLVG